MEKFIIIEDNNLKVGQSFDVVEILNSTYSKGLFKIGGHTIDLTGDGKILTNGWDYNRILIKAYGQYCAHMLKGYTKPIGKLTIKSLK